MAAKDNVLPIDNRSFARWDKRNRPSLLGERSHFTFYPLGRRITGGAFPDLSGRDWSVSVHLRVPASGASGTLIENGVRARGWGLFVVDGKATLIYKSSDNADGITRITAPEPLTVGEHVVTTKVVGNPVSHAGVASIVIDGKSVAQGEIAHLIPVFITDNAEIGWSFGSIDGTLPTPFVYPGAISHVDVDVAPKKES